MNIIKIILLAGEESGLIYADRLKDALQAARPDAVLEFRGFQSEGFKTADLAVMGFLPVLMRLFFFLGVARTMKRLIREWKPDLVVSVDYPDLNLKLDSYAKSLGIPAVHLVCPQVWAWRQRRIPKVAASLTKLLCFLPFETSIFAAYEGKGFSARFIGHPMVDLFAEEERNAARATQRDGRAPARPRLALLPGSRIGEIQRIMPRMLAALRLLEAKMPGTFEVLIPAASEKAYTEIERLVRAIPPSSACHLEILRGKAREVLRQADCAVVASGTATLESALARCPTVVVYAVAPIVAWFLRRMITGVRHVGLVNVIAERVGIAPPMPELLQEAFTPDAVATQIFEWLADADAREKAVAAIDEAVAHLKSDGDAIGNAAQEILSCV